MNYLEFKPPCLQCTCICQLVAVDAYVDASVCACVRACTRLLSARQGLLNRNFFSDSCSGHSCVIFRPTADPDKRHLSPTSTSLLLPYIPNPPLPITVSAVLILPNTITIATTTTAINNSQRLSSYHIHTHMHTFPQKYAQPYTHLGRLLETWSSLS